MLILQEGIRGNWGEWRVIGGIFGGISISANVLFRALPTYSDGMLHIPAHVLVFGECPRTFSSGGRYPTEFPQRYMSIEPGFRQIGQGSIPTDARVYYLDHSPPLKNVCENNFLEVLRNYKRF